VSTIERILRRKGLQKRTNKYYRRPLFQNGHAMRPKNTNKPGYLQMDVKYVTPELSGLPYTCYEYGLIDIFSRYKVSLILPILDESGSILALKWAIQSMPVKIVYVQTDNGLEYQKHFHKACEDLSIVHYHIHKSSPNENAVIERSFRVDQEEFYFRLKKQPKDINDLNQKFQQFLQYYNTERPHLGIDLMTPKEKLDTYQML
ncbi:MAG: integrase core domain-containing protein, partial [Candidatus Levyibacteriota bacterium]